jgi:hypothetical protein
MWTSTEGQRLPIVIPRWAKRRVMRDTMGRAGTYSPESFTGGDHLHLVIERRGIRWPRRRWGFEVFLATPNGYSDSDTSPARYWTRSGAERAAQQWIETGRHILPEAAFVSEIKQLPPPIDVYADKCWRGDTYIGPEV